MDVLIPIAIVVLVACLAPVHVWLLERPKRLRRRLVVPGTVWITSDPFNPAPRTVIAVQGEYVQYQFGDPALDMKASMDIDDFARRVLVSEKTTGQPAPQVLSRG